MPLHGRPRTLLVLVLLCLGAPLAVAQETNPPAPPPASAQPDNVDLDIQFTAPSAYQLHVMQTWHGVNARAMRQSLDVYFGAADGALTDSELDAIARASEADMRNLTFDWFLAGGQPVMIQGVRVSIHNASGTVASTTPLSIAHDLTLSVPQDPVTDGGARLDVTIHPMWPGIVRLTPLDGWHAERADGVAGAELATVPVQGSFSAGQSIQFSLRLGPRPVGPHAEGPPPEGPPPDGPPPGNPAEATDKPAPWQSVPAPSIPLVLIAAALVALGVNAHRRRK